MDRQLEKRLPDRAVAIGREGNVQASSELRELLRSDSANGRRLAASALGKLAWLGVDQAAAAATLRLFGYAIGGDERSEVSGNTCIESP